MEAIAAWLVLVGVVAGEVAQRAPRPEHPRPDFRRESWVNLNGNWQFRFDPDDRGIDEEWFAAGKDFDRRITVPFCWESPQSGIADTSGQRIGWYRRRVTVPPVPQGQRIRLCFGAVDWEARVWVNGRELGVHQGGYTPFAFDLTGHVCPGDTADIVVRAFDATDVELPTGKQHPSWYTPVSGIWQTVYLEWHPACHIEGFRLIPRRDGERWWLEGVLDAVGPDGTATVEFQASDPTVGMRTVPLEIREGRGRVEVKLPVQSPRLWTPDDPHLYDLEIALSSPGSGPSEKDTVHTYFGLRTIERGRWGNLKHEVVLLNGQPIYLRGALDQSYNPRGLYTAPTDQFLRRDFEIAKRAGFNFLRIHIKSEEPRRLYWADRLGVLLMEDMPCTWKQSPRARAAWETTMRETIRRDANHPSIIAWCLFNETWGLGGEGYKQDRDTQQWVLDRWHEVKRELDPSRLVEDNSANRRDHVVTDVNSWHFYIDDYRRAREHVEEVVKNTYPGSGFNYVPGRTVGTAPLLNSEYGAVGARGGDRDVSWGFRHLTSELRRHELIQGYVYTELSDIEWEHNGVVDYDRSAKQFGYNAFVPGMGVADLQGADFLGFDAPPLLEAEPGGQFMLPVFVSHFSDRSEPPVLRWQVHGVDDLGRPVIVEPQTQPIVWERCRVTYQKPLSVSVPAGRPFVGAVCGELLDRGGKRLAANFVNLVVRPVVGEPAGASGSAAGAQPVTIEVLGPRLVMLRFAPGDLAAMRTDHAGWEWLENDGKLFAPGRVEVEYHLALPPFVREALPAKVVLLAELATKASTERLDWPARTSPLDYPQTQARTYPGKLGIGLMDRELARVGLPDDPADTRGLLSHQQRYHYGSYGFLVREQIDLTEEVEVRKALAQREFVPLVLRAVDGKGLTVYGRDLGRYLIDPTLIVETALDLARPVGWKSRDAVAIHRLLSGGSLGRGIATGEQGGHRWRYTTKEPSKDWAQPGFDDEAWATGSGGFGRTGTPGIQIETPWTGSDIWLRTELKMDAEPAAVVLRYFHDEDMEVYLNGKRLLRETGYVRQYVVRPLARSEIEGFRRGTNTIAVHCRQTTGGQGIDLGLRWMP